MQLSSYVFAPALFFLFGAFGFSEYDSYKYTTITWTISSFTIALIIILLLLKNEMRNEMNLRAPFPYGKVIGWGLLGVFLAMFAQSFAAKIMELIGLPLVSENTQSIVEMVEMSILIMIVPSIIGPILEEIVFRKILFGELAKRFGFFLSSIASSIVFAIVHIDFTHTLVYIGMGLVFCYLYKKTESILAPIIAHMLMNTLVLIVQLNMDKILEWQEKYNTIQSIFGGLL